MKASSSFAGGLAGACVLTLLHEVIRRVDPDAPRMDLLGMQALTRLIRKAGGEPPAKDRLFNITMAGDVLSNAIYYSAAGLGKKPGVWRRGMLLGVAAAAGTILLPKPLGLDEKPSSRTLETKLLTIALYTAGGLVTAAALNMLKNRK